MQWKFTTTVVSLASKLDFLSHAPASPSKKLLWCLKSVSCFPSPREAAEKFNEMKINSPRIFSLREIAVHVNTKTARFDFHRNETLLLENLLPRLSERRRPCVSGWNSLKIKTKCDDSLFHGWWCHESRSYMCKLQTNSRFAGKFRCCERLTAHRFRKTK